MKSVICCGFVGPSVDLAKHVGHKVIVKGVAGEPMGGMATLTVKSIKMVGSSCSQAIAR